MNKKLTYFNSLVTIAYRKKGEKLIHYKDSSYSFDELKKVREFYIKEFDKRKTLYGNLDPLGIKLNEKAIEHITERRDKIKLHSKAKAWLGRQRKLRREGKLDQDKINELNKLGMVWNPTTDMWEKHYTEIRNSGRLTDEDDFWIKQQRELYKSGLMPKENKIRLELIGFPFTSSNNEKLMLSWYQVCVLYGDFESEKYGDKKQDFILVTGQRIISTIIEAGGRLIGVMPEWRIRFLDENNKIERLKSKTLENLNNKNDDDFKKEIDKIYLKKSNKKKGTNSEKEFFENQLYEIERFVRGDIPLNNDKYSIYSSKTVSYKFSNEVKIYACETAKKYLEEKLLEKHDLTHHAEGFYVIKRLISLYSQEKKIKKLKELKIFIERHKILSIFHSEEIDKILKKM